MHFTKNVCESLLATLFNMPDKIKDGPKTKTYLMGMGIREELQASTEKEETGKGKNKTNKHYCPPSCFTLTEKELDQVFKCLVGVKVTSGYSGVIPRYLDMKKQKYSGMKSHDCHVMMMQILPVTLRGIMDKHVRDTLIGLCNFFDEISRKSISLKHLVRLQEEIMVILCELEIYSPPPAFFDVMVHLLVHIVPEIIDLGPLFLHNMMPFKKMNGLVKGYVCNRAHPDGSIV
jgi:hypothetical protein